VKIEQQVHEQKSGIDEHGRQWRKPTEPAVELGCARRAKGSTGRQEAPSWPAARPGGQRPERDRGTSISTRIRGIVQWYGLGARVVETGVFRTKKSCRIIGMESSPPIRVA